MDYRIKKILTITLLLSLIAVSSVSNDQNSLLPGAEAAQEKITEDEAAGIAAKASGGQVLGSDTSGVEGVSVYRFKVLMKDGQVKIVKVNAATGEVQ